MKAVGVLFFFVSGLALSTLTSYLGWWLKIHGIAVFWLVALIAIALFLIWSISTAASAKTQAGLEFGLFDLVQASLPAIACLLLVILCNGVGLWLAV